MSVDDEASADMYIVLVWLYQWALLSASGYSRSTHATHAGSLLALVEVVCCGAWLESKSKLAETLGP